MYYLPKMAEPMFPTGQPIWELTDIVELCRHSRLCINKILCAVQWCKALEFIDKYDLNLEVCGIAKSLYLVYF